MYASLVLHEKKKRILISLLHFFFFNFRKFATLKKKFINFNQTLINKIARLDLFIKTMLQNLFLYNPI